MTVRLGHEMAPWEGIEPPTNWLTANCSTAELPRKIMNRLYKIQALLNYLKALNVYYIQTL